MTQNAKPTVFSFIEEAASRSPQAIALLGLERIPLTYERLRIHIEEVIHQLNAKGIGRQDRVAVVLPNGPAMATAFLSTASCSTCAPLNPGYRKEEYDFYLSDLKAKALIVEQGTDSPARVAARNNGIAVLDLVSHPEVTGLFSFAGDRSAAAVKKGLAHSDDPALVLHTSGTTSKPKLVPLSHINLSDSAKNVRRSLALTCEDRCLNIMPLFHIHGIIAALLSSLAAGASVVCTPGFNDASFFQWYDMFRPTWYTAVPTMHQVIHMLSRTHRELIESSPLRLIRSCSSALPPALMSDLEATMKAPVIEAYGMTETAHQIASNPLPPKAHKPGSVGLAAGPEVAIMDQQGRLLEPGQVGEIVIRGSNVMSAYENRPQANEEAFTKGWFRSGDQGMMDADGYIFIKGRLKEIINRGGEKISPREIDETLLDHPDVAQAVTFAIPHWSLGEDVVAAVVLHKEQQTAAREIRAYAFDHLADFKVPSQILVVPKIPKGPTGKIQRVNLADQLADFLNSRHEDPDTQLEKFLVDIWVHLLGVERIGVHDNFFKLGGDSLRAAEVVEMIQQRLKVELPIPVIFREPTIRELAEWIANRCDIDAGAAIFELKNMANKKRVESTNSFLGLYPLSYKQLTWWSYRWVEKRTFNSELKFLCYKGDCEEQIMAQAVELTLQKYDIFWMQIFSNIPLQRPRRPGTYTLPIHDLRSLTPQKANQTLQQIVRRMQEESTDLMKFSPMANISFVMMPNDEYCLLLLFPFIIMDSGSFLLFMQSLQKIYNNLLQGKPLPPPRKKTGSWTAYVLRGRERYTRRYFERGNTFWQDYFKGVSLMREPDINPTEKEDRLHSKKPYNDNFWLLEKACLQSLDRLAERHSCSIGIVFSAILCIALHQILRQNDVIIKVLFSGRTKETEKEIGQLTEDIHLRVNIETSQSFEAFLEKMQNRYWEAFEYRDNPEFNKYGAYKMASGQYSKIGYFMRALLGKILSVVAFPARIHSKVWTMMLCMLDFVPTSLDPRSIFKLSLPGDLEVTMNLLPSYYQPFTLNQFDGLQLVKATALAEPDRVNESERAEGFRVVQLRIGKDLQERGKLEVLGLWGANPDLVHLTGERFIWLTKTLSRDPSKTIAELDRCS